MIEHGEVYAGYRQNKWYAPAPKKSEPPTKSRSRVVKRNIIDINRFMEVFSNDKTWQQIGDELNVSNMTALKFAQKIGLTKKRKVRKCFKNSVAKSPSDITDLNEFMKVFSPEKTWQQIGYELGISMIGAYQIGVKLGIKKTQLYRENKCSRDKFMAVFSHEKTWKQIADELGVLHCEAFRIAARLGIKKDQCSSGVRKRTNAEIIEAFEKNPGLSVKDLAKIVDLQQSSLRQRLIRLKLIKSRLK
jgi:orotate phosphoribosyltransferase-like protein